jgi:hypothetical protein
MFCKEHDNTVIHASNMGYYMLHAQKSEALKNIYIPFPEGKTKKLQ